MLTWSTLRSRADRGHVAAGTTSVLVSSACLLLGVANPPDASTLGVVARLLVRVAFLLLVAALLGAVALVYCPELPRRLIAWLTKHEDPLLTADSDVRD